MLRKKLRNKRDKMKPYHIYVPELPEDITCGMKSRLISCIFCKCQILASPDLAKYEDHLQVSLADADNFPIC